MARRPLYPSCHPPALRAPLRPSSAPSPGQSDASVTGQKSLRDSPSVLSVWSSKLPLRVAGHVQRCREKTSGIHSRTANKLPHLSRAMTLGSWVSPIQACASLNQTTGKKPMRDQVGRQVQTGMERGQRQKRRESKRTRVERSGPTQSGFTLSDPHPREEPGRAPEATWRGLLGD